MQIIDCANADMTEKYCELFRGFLLPVKFRFNAFFKIVPIQKYLSVLLYRLCSFLEHLNSTAVSCQGDISPNDFH